MGSCEMKIGDLSKEDLMEAIRDGVCDAMSLGKEDLCEAIRNGVNDARCGR